jgi:hypothetical protein
VHFFRDAGVFSEPLHMATGGPWKELPRRVEELAEGMRKASLTAHFVFQGVRAPALVAPPTQTAARIHAQRFDAWREYEAGRVRNAASMFRDAGEAPASEATRAALRVLLESGVSAFHAPFEVGAQLAWLVEQRLVHAAVGGAELLIFGVQRVILSLDLAQGRAELVDLAHVLSTLRATHEQLVDACLLAGFRSLRTLPSLAANFSFQACLDAAQHSRVESMANAAHAKALDEARAALLQQCVLKPGALCELLHPSPAAAAHAAALGPQLSAGALALIVKGAASSECLGALISGVMCEAIPAVDCKEVEGLVQYLVPMWRLALRQWLVAGFVQLPSPRGHVVFCRWFEEEPKEHSRPLLIWDTASAPTLLVADVSFWASVAAQVGQDEVGVLGPLRWIQGPGARDARAAAAAAAAVRLSLPSEVRCAATLSALLTCTALFEADGRRLSKLGSALAAVSTGHFDEPLLCAALLVYSGCLDGRVLSLRSPEGREFFSGTNQDREVRLISRVASLLPLQTEAKAWTGLLDRDMSAFNGLVKMLLRCLRDSTESAVASLFACGIAEPTVLASPLRVFDLPFACDAGTMLGVVMRRFMQGVDVARLAAEFPQAQSIERDLAAAVELWGQLFKVVQRSDLDVLIRQSFANADMHLRARLKSAPLAAAERLVHEQTSARPDHHKQQKQQHQHAGLAVAGERTKAALGEHKNQPEPVEFGDVRYWRRDFSYLHLNHLEELDGEAPRHAPMTLSSPLRSPVGRASSWPTPSEPSAATGSEFSDLHYWKMARASAVTEELEDL